MQTVLYIISNFNLRKILIIGIIFFSISGSGLVLAQVTSNFQQTITDGNLDVNITDSSYAPVVNPSVTMDSAEYSVSCQTVEGVLGTASEQIYIQNLGAADGGWTLAIATDSATDLWASAGTPFDFNDPSGSGCTDGADSDSVGGQMTLDPSAGSINSGQCSGCDTTNISLGSLASFSEGVTDSITIATATAESNDIGDWYIRGIDVFQTIPAEQPAASDYNIDMVLTISTS